MECADNQHGLIKASQAGDQAAVAELVSMHASRSLWIFVSPLRQSHTG